MPEINARLEAAGSAKRFRNLIGYTWGTGFGVGIVSDNRLHIGDNSCVETFCLRHKDLPDINVEEGVSIRAVKRLYAEYAGVDDDTLDPKAIFEIAEGERPGDADAARRAFARFGEVAGDAMATAVTLIDRTDRLSAAALPLRANTSCLRCWPKCGVPCIPFRVKRFRAYR